MRNETKQFFTAKRFMDDILMAYVENDYWNTHAFLKDFKKSECYQQPLKLESGKEGIFLETAYWVEDNEIKFKLKNDNEDNDNTVWRYQHWHSNTSMTQKISTLNACLKKTERASNDNIHVQSALAKLTEFKKLRYPTHILQRVCARLGATSSNGAWIQIRSLLN